MNFDEDDKDATRRPSGFWSGIRRVEKRERPRQAPVPAKDARPKAVAERNAPVKQERAAPAAPERPLMTRTGDKPAERIPVILENQSSSGFRLIDSGAGEKLEQYGDYRVVRLKPRRSGSVRSSQTLGACRRRLHRRHRRGRYGSLALPQGPLGETWPMQLLDVDFHGRFTSFRHVGVFPEQQVHWDWMRQEIEKAKRPVKVLNLFGYTGVASLIAAAAVLK